MKPIIVNEMYVAVQGEGRFTGHPAVFLRLQGCNLDCAWCDSKYTWHPKFMDTGKKMTVKEVIDYLGQYHHIAHVVITGGEPMLQIERLRPVIQWLTNMVWTVEIETNGTVEPPDWLLELPRVYANISPKTTLTSGITKELKFKEKWYGWIYLERAIFKFVIENETHLAHVLHKFVYPYPLADSFSRRAIWLMPQGYDPETVISNSKKVMELAKKHGFMFSPRLHILVYGNKRGV